MSTDGINLNIPEDLVDEIANRLVDRVVAKLADHLGQQETTPGRMAFSEAEASELLGVEPHVLREQRRLGRIEHSRIGRRIAYTPEQLADFLEGKGGT